MIEFAQKIVFVITSARTRYQFIFIFVSKFQMNVAEKLINVGQLQYLLIRDNENQLEFIVQLVLQR